MREIKHIRKELFMHRKIKGKKEGKQWVMKHFRKYLMLNLSFWIWSSCLCLSFLCLYLILLHFLTLCFPLRLIFIYSILFFSPFIWIGCYIYFLFSLFFLSQCPQWLFAVLLFFFLSNFCLLLSVFPFFFCDWLFYYFFICDQIEFISHHL